MTIALLLLLYFETENNLLTTADRGGPTITLQPKHTRYAPSTYASLIYQQDGRKSTVTYCFLSICIKGVGHNDHCSLKQFNEYNCMTFYIYLVD